MQKIVCKECNYENNSSAYFCHNCGILLKNDFENKELANSPQMRMARILSNLEIVPHYDIIWDNMIDLYLKKVERCKSILRIPELNESASSNLWEKIDDFVEMCHNPEFQIAFVGTIKTGKSTLINALLGNDYASMDVTPETAALTKFRTSVNDYVNVTFYNKKEWEKLWKSRSSGADTFMAEYNALNAEQHKKKWVDHKPLNIKLVNSEVKTELTKWSSSKYPEHYFVKEIEVGLSSLPKEFPTQVVFVDTPGLSDPVAYRSEITKQYIRKANAVFVCIDAQKIQKEELETISSVFSFSAHAKHKVHLIATHWDALNHPIEDWAKQKEYLESKLVGKAFYDTPEMAKTNIMHSAAYVYNLCRDYKNPNNMMFLFQTAMKLGLLTPESFVNMEKALSDSIEPMKKLSNISVISEVIKSKLISSFKELLNRDIENKYKDIMYNLERFTSEGKKDTNELIEAFSSNIDELQKKVDDKKKDYEEVSMCKIQLDRALEGVKLSTEKRMKAILPMLEVSDK